MNRCEMFKKVYKNSIFDLERSLRAQIRSLIVLESGRSLSVSINISDEVVTGIKCEESHNGLTLMTDMVYRVDICWNDVETLYQHDHLKDEWIALNMIIQHLYLHLSFDHYRRYNHKLAGYVNGRMPYIHDHHEGAILSIFCEKGCPDVESKYDPVIYQMASDLEINGLLRIGKGNNEFSIKFPNPAAFGLPVLPHLCYYAIIWHTLMSLPEKGENGHFQSVYFESKGFITWTSTQFAIYAPIFVQWYRYLLGVKDDLMPLDGLTDLVFSDLRETGMISCTIDDEKRDEVEKKDRLRIKYEIAQGDIPGAIQKMHDANGGVWHDFQQIFNSLKFDLNTNLSMVDKVQDWTKWNSRKGDGNDFLYPGYRQIKGTIERKLEIHSVLFVDVSGSMNDVIEPLFAFCFLCLKHLSMTIVFYDTEIKKIIRSDENFGDLEPFTVGGTNVKSAVEQYCSEYKKPSNLFVLTDGEDYTLSYVKKDYRCRIWKIRRGKVEEIV